MRIILAGEIFPPALGGPATYTPKLAKSLHERGHEIMVICYSDASMKNDSYKFPVIRIPFSRFKIGHYLRYTKQLFLHTKKADVVYAQGPVASGLPSAIVTKILRKKLIIKVVGDYAWEQARGNLKTDEHIDTFQKTMHKGYIGLLQKIERFTINSANKVVVPSEYLKKIVNGWGKHEKDISVIYNGVAGQIGLGRVNRDYDTIVSIGRLVPWKGFKMLIDIMPELLKHNPKFRLLLLGRGPLEDELRHRINELKMEDYIKIKHVLAKERDIILSEAALFVLNTDYEGLSHAILETMASGVPIITTKTGGNPELIEDGKNGILLSFNDNKSFTEAITRLIRDPEKCMRFINESKSRVRHFSEERMLRETLQLLETV